ncbi:hypothetical protein CRUP_028135 [Coryphaenoides rupestris]|nr:hypothetical protein CRUP_028135 [Coryphaenoides rupestris]
MMSPSSSSSSSSSSSRQGGLTAAARVTVFVADVNDNRPTFYPTLYTVSLSSHSAPGTSVVKVTANDPDSGENGRVTYRTVPGGGSTFFTLNKDTGVISLSRSLHGKANTVVSMVISAEDGGGLAAPAHARVNVSVVAGSVAPPVFEQAQYFFTVPEDVSATDEDRRFRWASITYSLRLGGRRAEGSSSAKAPFTVGGARETGRLCNQRRADRDEARELSSWTVTATDGV